LPEPTSPWSSRSIGDACARSPSISPIERRWAPVSGKRQRELAAQAAVALQRLTAPLAVVGAHQHQRETVRQQLVVGETVARRGMLALVRKHERIAPAGPLVPVEQAGLDPLVQLGRACKSLLCEAGDLRLGQPFGEGIDRLDQVTHEPGTGVGDVLGVHDLQPLVVLLELAGNPALLADREQLLGGVRSLAEVDERAVVALRVLRQHAVRRAAVRAGPVLDGGQGHDHLLADLRFVEIGHRPALHEPVGQMVGQIAHAGEAELLERLLQLRSDALEALGLGEQRVEQLRAHCAAMPNGAAYCEPDAGTCARLRAWKGQGVTAPRQEIKSWHSKSLPTPLRCSRPTTVPSRSCSRSSRARAATARSRRSPRRSAPSSRFTP
jgi:hypothetical protein